MEEGMGTETVFESYPVQFEVDSKDFTISLSRDHDVMSS